MRNDTIETLLLRHYGSTAQTPVDLQDSLSASIQSEIAEHEKEQQLVTRLRERRISRRNAVRLITIDAGLEGLGLALEGVRVIEAALKGQDVAKPAFS